jgi:hypothetical protein
MANIEKCPVCEGSGLVPNGFYNQIGGSNWGTTSCMPETCRSCEGRGYIPIFPVIPDIDRLSVKPPKQNKMEDGYTESKDMTIARQKEIIAKQAWQIRLYESMSDRIIKMATTLTDSNEHTGIAIHNKQVNSIHEDILKYYLMK